MIQIPQKIKDLTANKNYTKDSVGMSDSQVILFDDMVLKIQQSSNETVNEAEMMKWLYNKLPVPELLAYETENDTSFILMSKIKGNMLCSDFYTDNSEKLLSLLADGLKQLWSINVENCPCNNTIDFKLAAAKFNVENGFVDLDNTEPETFGKSGFNSPEDLLKWLKENKPEEELALTHGDFSLQNIFAENDKISGFIDLGKAGIADKWQDIAICYRSLKHIFSSKQNDKFHPDMLFEKLEIEKNEEKLKYYILLDELF